MNCPRCRGVAPSGVSFCPHCGNDLRLFQQAPTKAAQVPVKEQLKKAAKGAPAGYFQPAAAGAGAASIPLSSKKSKLPWIIASVVLLLAIGSGFLIMNMLKKTASPDKMLQKNGNQNGPMLKKVGDEMPFLAKTGSNPPPGPEPDLRWLYHLERIEKKRGEIYQKHIANLKVSLQSFQFGTNLDGLKALATGDPDVNMPDTAPEMLSEQSAEMKKDWAELKRDFDSFPPPEDCKTIAEPYSHALVETPSMMTDVMDAIDIATKQGDPQGAVRMLEGMKTKSANIDRYGSLADERVQALCSKYNKRKWFVVHSDFDNANMLQSVGMR